MGRQSTAMAMGQCSALARHRVVAIPARPALLGGHAQNPLAHSGAKPSLAPSCISPAPSQPMWPGAQGGFADPHQCARLVLRLVRQLSVGCLLPLPRDARKMERPVSWAVCPRQSVRVHALLAWQNDWAVILRCERREELGRKRAERQSQGWGWKDGQRGCQLRVV